LLVFDPAKATVDMVLEMCKVAGTLNTALFAVAAALTIKGHDWSSRWGTFEATCVVLALICGAVSYLGVYHTYTALLGMLYVGSLNVFENRLRAGLAMQYYGILLGVFLLGWVFSRMLETKHTSANQPIGKSSPL